MKKILVIAGGRVEKKLAGFVETGSSLGISLTCASFADLEFSWETIGDVLVSGLPVSSFDVIYIRMVGKRLEQASILVDYAKKHNIRLVDRVYQKAQVLPSTVSKALEMKLLIEGGVSIPRTYFGSVQNIFNKAEKLFGFPYVVKSTSGRRGRDAWSPEDENEAYQLFTRLKRQEKEGKAFFAQEFIPCVQRDRIFVLGGKVLAGITMPTKWRKRVGLQEGEKGAIKVSASDGELAIAAANAVGLEICGVDIIHDQMGKSYVIEANAAPSWKAVTKYCGISVEEEIIKYLGNS